MVMLILFGSATEKKSALGCFFSLRSNMGYWFGKMESCMVLSTAEAKDVANCYLGGSMFLLKTTILFA